jgi:cellulose synthase/poly-beta-1,6-N-acetylglucosamine synthase-like glycosyltransferase
MGEALYTVEIDEVRLNRLLETGERGRYVGPSHHGSMMFRRSVYEAVGGYRAAFHFAQDLDLWTRLIERGRFALVAQALYQATLEPRSISGTQTQEQRQLAEIITAATRTRRAGGDEAPHLAAATQVRPVRRRALPQRVAWGYYFIGACLRRNSPRAAQKYFRQALALDPWLWRARLRWLQVAVAGFLKASS